MKDLQKQRREKSWNNNVINLKTKWIATHQPNLQRNLSLPKAIK